MKNKNFITLFESEVTKYFVSFDPTLKQCIFSDDIQNFTAMSPKVVYPSMYFLREATEYIAVDTMKLVDGKNVTSFWVVPINYTGRIYMEKMSECVEYMRRLRFYWQNNSYVHVHYYDGDISVGLRLLYIKIESDRDNWKDRGPQRCVEFKWFSQLFLSADEIWYPYSAFTINVEATNGKQIVDGFNIETFNIKK